MSENVRGAVRAHNDDNTPRANLVLAHEHVLLRLAEVDAEPAVARHLHQKRAAGDGAEGYALGRLAAERGVVESRHLELRPCTNGSEGQLPFPTGG